VASGAARSDRASPDPAVTQEALIRVFAAQAVSWRGVFSVHSLERGEADRRAPLHSLRGRRVRCRQQRAGAANRPDGPTITSSGPGRRSCSTGAARVSMG
jgi:hypothetical protein